MLAACQLPVPSCIACAISTLQATSGRFPGRRLGAVSAAQRDGWGRLKLGTAPSFIMLVIHHVVSVHIGIFFARKFRDEQHHETGAVCHPCSQVGN